ncbi:MAG: glycosyltransferase [Geobacteraceae bacterium]|nr:glycosyltransferase [Geobacteraceae bacterium]
MSNHHLNKFMMHVEIVSILVPCLNEKKYIYKCLCSVLDFEIPDGIQLEVFVLDGGSTDGTREIVAKFTTNDSRIRLIDNPGRIQSCALNIGIIKSKGNWVMRLDAHTHYPSNYLMLCYKTALNTGADNVGGICITYPGGEQYEAQLVQALTTHIFGVGNSGFRTGAKAGPRDTVPFGFFSAKAFLRKSFSLTSVW